MATAEFFQICWHIECSTLTASSFRILNSSAEVQSPSLALFVVMLPKAHLTLYSRMPSSSWVTTSSWLSGSLRPFLYSSSVYSCHLHLVSSASVIVPILAWNIPLISPIFLKRSLVFPTLVFFYFFALFIEERLLFSPWLFLETLHSVGYIFPFLPCFLLLFFPQLFVRPHQTTTLPSCISFSLGWFWSLPPI